MKIIQKTNCGNKSRSGFQNILYSDNSADPTMEMLAFCDCWGMSIRWSRSSTLALCLPLSHNRVGRYWSN